MSKYLCAVAPATALLLRSASPITIAGARVVDGAGAPPRSGNVRLEGDRIAAVGKIEPRDDRRGDRLVERRARPAPS
jgi:hypothetical protein